MASALQEFRSKGLPLVRVGAALAATAGSADARQLVEMKHGFTSREFAVLEKSASVLTPGSSALAGNLDGAALATQDFIEAINAETIIGRIANSMIRLPTDRASKNVIDVSLTGAAAWIGENQEIGMSGVTVKADYLRPAKKIGTILVGTKEFFAFVNPSTERLILNTVVAKLAEQIDRAAWDRSNAGSATTPKSFTNGCPTVAATANFKTDLEAAIKLFKGDLRRAFLVMPARLAVRLSGEDLGFQVGARGGTIAEIPVATSDWLASGPGNTHEAFLTDPASLVWSDDGAVEIARSKEATIKDNGGNTLPLWQLNLAAFKILRHMDFDRRGDAGSVVGITGIPA